ncbi:MAG: PaaI family thioesterase [Proteobacteria bacterium]|nr:PaaI family thioesterase [Pseudomonadota bacterium]
MIDSKMQQIIKIYNKDTFFRFLGFEVKSCADGYCLLSFLVHKSILNPAGTVHGGVLNALCSVAASLAALSMIDDCRFTVANDFNSSVMQGVSSGTLTIEGKVLKAGKRLVFVEVFIKDESGNYVAAARVTKSVLP